MEIVAIALMLALLVLPALFALVAAVAVFVGFGVSALVAIPAAAVSMTGSSDD